MSALQSSGRHPKEGVACLPSDLRAVVLLLLGERLDVRGVKKEEGGGGGRGGWFPAFVSGIMEMRVVLRCDASITVTCEKAYALIAGESLRELASRGKEVQRCAYYELYDCCCIFFVVNPVLR